MQEKPEEDSVWKKNMRDAVELGFKEKLREQELLNKLNEKLTELKQDPSPANLLQKWAQILAQQEPDSFKTGGENANDARLLFFIFALQTLNIADNKSLAEDTSLLNTVTSNQHDALFFERISNEIARIESSLLEMSEVNKDEILSYEETLSAKHE
jgi:hypothetical protein